MIHFHLEDADLRKLQLHVFSIGKDRSKLKGTEALDSFTGLTSE